MPRVCSICTHPKRAEIDKALLAGEASNRRVAAQYDVTERAIRDHKRNHLAARMQQAAAKNADADIRTAIDVVGQLRAINSSALQVLKDAREAKDGDLVLKAIDRIQRQLELQAKLMGELTDGPAINVLVAPEWLQLRATLLESLTPYPDARLAVSAALSALEVRHVA